MSNVADSVITDSTTSMGHTCSGLCTPPTHAVLVWFRGPAVEVLRSANDGRRRLLGRHGHFASATAAPEASREQANKRFPGGYIAKDGTHHRLEPGDTPWLLGWVPE